MPRGLRPSGARLAIAALCGLVCAEAARAEAEPPPTIATVSFAAPVRFATADGSTQSFGPGDFALSVTDAHAIALVSAEGSGVPIALSTRASRHAETLAGIETLHVEDEGLQRLLLLFPGGDTLEAVGFAGDVEPRGGLARQSDEEGIGRMRRQPLRSPSG